MSDSNKESKFSDHYPEYKEVEAGDVTYYMVEIIMGGRDEAGEFLLVLDGPAAGEKVYL